MNFSYRFPVVRGKQGNNEYYIAMIPLKMISKLFPNDEEYVAPEFRAQRKLNETRVPIITKYILDNRNSYVFSALAASIDGEFHFEPNHESKDTGILDISMDSRFLINDGQHRKAAILSALQEDKSLEDETFSIVFFEDKGLKRSQQIFTDLNKNAVRTSNSISELYDSRDSLAVATRNIISKNEFLNLYTDKEKDILGKYSPNFFTLNTFYTANRVALGKKTADDFDESFLSKFWNKTTVHVIPWQEVKNKELSKIEVREKYIVTQGVVIQALGRLANYFYKNQEDNKMNDHLKLLEKVNWKRTAPEWSMRAINTNGRIITNKRAVTLIANKIKQELQIPLSDDEQEYETQLTRIIKQTRGRI